jgi:hypothetical protein
MLCVYVLLLEERMIHKPVQTRRAQLVAPTLEGSKRRFPIFPLQTIGQTLATASIQAANPLSRKFVHGKRQPLSNSQLSLQFEPANDN